MGRLLVIPSSQILLLLAGLSTAVDKFVIPGNSNRYLTNKYCARHDVIYCREGSRGPCREGQVFVELPDPDSWPVDEEIGCFGEAGTDCIVSRETSNLTVSRNAGICVWADAEHPCRGYPSDHLFFNSTNRCQPIGVICGRQQLSYRVDGKYGECDCPSSSHIYWQEADTCFLVNTQGPCSEGHWLVMCSQTEPCCQKTACPTDGSYVFIQNPDNRTFGCYELNAQGFCQKGKILNRVQMYPEKIECGDSVVWTLNVGKAKNHECPAGSKLSISGHCKKPF